MDQRIPQKNSGRTNGDLAVIDCFAGGNYIGVSGITFRFLRS